MFYTTCLVRILLTVIITENNGTEKDKWDNKFVRGVQGQNLPALRNLRLNISNSMLSPSTPSSVGTLNIF